MSRGRCVCGSSVETTIGTCGASECELYGLGWDTLQLKREEGGWRHYLLEEPVSCGTGLLLEPAPVEEPDASDYSSSYKYKLACDAAASLREQRKEPLHVRYESPLSFAADRAPPALLYIEVGGHMALITAHSDMRLRWPFKER